MITDGNSKSSSTSPRFISRFEYDLEPVLTLTTSFDYDLDVYFTSLRSSSVVLCSSKEALSWLFPFSSSSSSSNCLKCMIGEIPVSPLEVLLSQALDFQDFLKILLWVVLESIPTNFLRRENSFTNSVFLEIDYVCSMIFSSFTTYPYIDKGSAVDAESSWSASIWFSMDSSIVGWLEGEIAQLIASIHIPISSFDVNFTLHLFPFSSIKVRVRGFLPTFHEHNFKLTSLTLLFHLFGLPETSGDSFE